MLTISVIVPVYKVEPYLDRCVNSIVNQTFGDFELILVDDGSPDNCPAMCDGWAKKDSRIRVIHKENGGLSDARNAGFRASKGQWILFIDSDDYVHPRLLEVLYRAVQEHKVQVAVSPFVRTGGESLQEAADPQSKLWPAEDYYLQQNINATVAWGKLYHRSVVLPYPEGKLHEDEFVTYRILFRCGNIAVANSPLYAYFQNAEGIIKSKWKPERMVVFEAMEEQIRFFTQEGYETVAKRRCRNFAGNICWQLQRIRADYPAAQGRRYAAPCRKKLRQVLRTYKKQAGFTVVSDALFYCEAYPAAAPLLTAWQKLRLGLSKTVKKLLSPGAAERK